MLPAWVSQRDRSRYDNNFQPFRNPSHTNFYRELVFIPLSLDTCWTLLNHLVASLKLDVPFDDSIKQSKAG